MQRITCSNCGRVWEFTPHRIPARNFDCFVCDCGKRLKSWDGACYFTVELVDCPKQPDDSE